MQEPIAGVLAGRGENAIESRIRRKCPVCGAKFCAGEKYAYRRKRDGVILFFCRYNCMRAWDQRIEENEKEKAIQRQEKAQIEREQEKTREARQRVEKCRERLDYWRDKMKKPGEAARYKDGRETIQKSVRVWEKKLDEAKMKLEQIERRREDDA